MWKRPSPIPVSLNSLEVARRAGGEWVARAGAFRTSWTLDAINAQDAVAVRVDVSAAIELLSDAAERTLFAETFRTASVSENDVRRHLELMMKSAVARFASAHSADALLNHAAELGLPDVIREALDAAAFGCGIRVHPPVSMGVSSPEWDQRKRDDARRGTALRAAADRAEVARHSVSLLQQWHAMHEAFPSLNPAQLLERLDTADRGAAVTDTLAASPIEPATFWAVAGRMLLRLDWPGAPSPAVVYPLPADLGPLRSVLVSANRLLVGARDGVMIVNAVDATVVSVLRGPSLASEHGYSALLDGGAIVWAAHRDAGLVGWDVDGESLNAQVPAARINGRVTALFAAQDGAGVAVDHEVLTITSTGEMTPRWRADSPIIAVYSNPAGLDVVCRDGTIHQLDSTWTVTRSTGTRPCIVAACPVPWLWSTRWMVCGDEGQLQCHGIDDDVVTAFTSRVPIGRALAGRGGKIVAMTADREGLIGWSLDSPRSPAVHWPAAKIAGSRVAALAAPGDAR